MTALANAIMADVEHAAAMLRRLSDTDVAKSRGAGKWVGKQILGHLIDSAFNNHQRFVHAQFANPFSAPGYDQEAWVRLHRYERREWSELVELWVAVNRQIAVVIAAVPDDRLHTICIIGEREPSSLEWWLRDYHRHLKHHLVQLGVPVTEAAPKA